MTNELNRKEQCSGYPVENFSLKTPLDQEIQGVHLRPTGDAKGTIVYGIGWGTDTAMHLPAMQELANLGYNVWSINPPRMGSILRQSHYNVADIEVNKAVGVVSLLQKIHENGISDVMGVAHSEGAIYTTIAALLSEKSESVAKIRSMVLVEPAGFMGKDNVVALASRFARQAAKNVLHHPMLYIKNRRSGRGIMAPLTSFKEAIAISSTKTPELLQQLFDRDQMPVGIIGGNQDGVFPASRMRRNLENVGFPFVYSALDVRHNGIYTQSKTIATEVVRMFEQFRLHEEL